jgi:hypothetical protein
MMSEIAELRDARAREKGAREIGAEAGLGKLL